MKKFIFAMIALSTTAVVSLASADSLAPRRSMLKLEGRYFNADYRATVDNYGQLQVATKIGEAKKIVRKQLSTQTLIQLSGTFQSLSRAEIKTVQQDVVCMLFMMPTEESNLFVSTLEEGSNLPTGKLVETLSEEGCWISRHVFPAEDYALDQARQIKKVLEILVYENGDFTGLKQF